MKDNEHKRRSHLRLVRTSDAEILEEHMREQLRYEEELAELKGPTFRERMLWRGIEYKSALLGIVCLSVIVSTTVVLLFSAVS